MKSKRKRGNKEVKLENNQVSENYAVLGNTMLADKGDNFGLFVPPKNRLKFICIFFLILVLSKLFYFFLIKNFNAPNPLLDYKYILCPIIFYYLNLLYLNFNTTGITLVGLNITLTFATYKQLLSSNPFDMYEVSSAFFISNIYYFYISFFFFALNYRFFIKLSFINDLLFEFIELTKRNVAKAWFFIMLLLITYGLFFPTVFKAETTVNFFIGLFCLAFVIYYIGYLRIGLSNINRSIYLRIKYFLESKEELINIFSDWIHKITKVEKINQPLLVNEKGFINYRNLIIFIFAKIFALYLLTLAYNTNFYYFMYGSINNEYCQGNEVVNKNSIIIKLKNGNALIHVDGEYKEITCIKKTKELKIMYLQLK